MYGKKVSLIDNWKPGEITIGPYNTVSLKLLKSNMNLLFVTAVYAMLKYIRSYLCKPEHSMKELIKKASKEAYCKYVKV